MLLSLYSNLINFSYNIELWFNYATVTQKEKLLHPFERNEFYLDVNFVCTREGKKSCTQFYL